METFADRLKSEIEYSGLMQKEVAYRAGIKKRALDMYLGVQGSMPPADVAVKIAKVLNVSVEYLVTGEQSGSSVKRDFRQLEQDLSSLSAETAAAVEALIHRIVIEKKTNTDSHAGA